MANITKQGTGPWWVGIQFKCSECQLEATLDASDHLYGEHRGDGQVLAAKYDCPSCGHVNPVWNPKAR